MNICCLSSWNSTEMKWATIGSHFFLIVDIYFENIYISKLNKCLLKQIFYQHLLSLIYYYVRFISHYFYSVSWSTHANHQHSQLFHIYFCWMDIVKMYLPSFTHIYSIIQMFYCHHQTRHETYAQWRLRWVSTDSDGSDSINDNQRCSHAHKHTNTHVCVCAHIFVLFFNSQ